jgi:hypothetical protein
MQNLIQVAIVRVGYYARNTRQRKGDRMVGVNQHRSYAKYPTNNWPGFKLELSCTILGLSHNRRVSC